MSRGVLFTLGPVAFVPGGVHLDGVLIRDEWRHNFQRTVRGRGKRSYTGKGNQEITFTGAVFPGQFGIADAPALLRRIGNTGRPQQLIDGSGRIVGRFVILSLEEERVRLLADGTGRQVNYTIELKEDPRRGPF